MKQEANLSDLPDSYTHDASDSVLQAYQSEGDPNSYVSSYVELRKFVDSALDIYKVRKYIFDALVKLTELFNFSTNSA